MLQSAVNYGRVLARAVVAGLTTENQRFTNQLQQHKSNNKPVHFISAVAGFSKATDSATSNLQSKWCYGEDAYFISRTKNASVLGMSCLLLYQYHVLCIIVSICMYLICIVCIRYNCM